jgi:hypothetical protein
MEVKSLNELSYEWLRVLKYNYERKNTSIESENDIEQERTGDQSNSVKSAKSIFTNRYENIHVNQMIFSFNYDFEYIGKVFLYI